MKGLIITSIIIVALIGVGIGTSIIITSGLSSRVAAANERGYEEGYSQGYLVGSLEGNKVGYQEGSKIGYIDSNGGDYNSSYGTGFYFTYNPTYEGMREILAEGKASSVGEIHDYAEANGIRSAHVRVQITREATGRIVYVYELVAFETVDKGLIIIEPWSHREVKVEIGKNYSELNSSPISSHDDTITKITIIW